MKVKLINATSDAVNLLLFTKNTRLMNDDDAYEKVSQWDEEKKQSDPLGSLLTTHLMSEM